MTVNFTARVVNADLVEVRTVRHSLFTASVIARPGPAPSWRVRLHQPSQFWGAGRPDGRTYSSWQEACSKVAGWSGDTYEVEGQAP